MTEGEQDKGQGPPLARYAGAGKYEAFTTKWHYLKENRMRRAKARNDAFRQQISMNILKLFYLLPYDGNTDFIHSLCSSNGACNRQALSKTYINMERLSHEAKTLQKSIFCGNFLRAAALLFFFISFLCGKSSLLRRRPGRLPGSHALRRRLQKMICPFFQQNFASYPAMWET